MELAVMGGDGAEERSEEARSDLAMVFMAGWTRAYARESKVFVVGGGSAVGS